MSQRLRASKSDWLRTKAGQKQPGAFEDEHPITLAILDKVIMTPEQLQAFKIPKPAVITGPLYVPTSASNKKELNFVVDGEPCRACRMTQSDKWRTPRRPAVQKYFDYRDRVRSAVSAQNSGEIPASPDGLHCVFYFAVPESWSKKKKALMMDKPHKQTPDRDNLEKAVMDALFDNDAGIWYGRTEKRWCAAGQERVTITIIYGPVPQYPRSDYGYAVMPPVVPLVPERALYFIDSEFIENGTTIDIISTAIVASDGRTLYFQNIDCKFDKASDWVWRNVFPHLSHFDMRGQRNCNPSLRKSHCYDADCPWRSHSEIRDAVRAFCDPEKYGKPEFWGYFASYDWVAFCQLFGTMMDLPKGYPMYCRDLKQWCDDLGNPALPEQGKGEHNALADAMWNKSTYTFLEIYERTT